MNGLPNSGQGGGGRFNSSANYQWGCRGPFWGGDSDNPGAPNWLGRAGANTGGKGGSGVVFIAFPTTSPITSNKSANLSSTVSSYSSFNDVLIDKGLTGTAYNSIQGAYATKLVNYNYYGNFSYYTPSFMFYNVY